MSFLSRSFLAMVVLWNAPSFAQTQSNSCVATVCAIYAKIAFPLSNCIQYTLSTPNVALRTFNVYKLDQNRSCDGIDPAQAKFAMDNLTKLAKTLKQDGVCHSIVNNIDLTEE